MITFKESGLAEPGGDWWNVTSSKAAPNARVQPPTEAQP